MIVLYAIIFLAPALIGVICYERFKGYELILRKRVELLIALAFFVNLALYGMFWLRGWGYISWFNSDNSSFTLVSFVFQYMAISFVAAVVIAYVLSLVRIGKSERNASDDDSESLKENDEEITTQEK